MIRQDVRLTVHVTSDDGERIPTLNIHVDPRCLRYTVGRNIPVSFEIKHVEECACGQLPVTGAGPGIQIGDHNTQHNTF